MRTEPARRVHRPYHDRADVNGGGPHGEGNAVADVNGGQMNGFIRERDAARPKCKNPDDPACSASGEPDVMGYHTAAEIPNYWTYAKDFVLQDHMFEPVKSWSLPDHLYLVSAWSARCKNRSPMSCVNKIVGPYGVVQFNRAVRPELTTGKTSIDLAWTDITWLLFAKHVSWAYYVQKGIQPDCANDSAETCAPVRQSASTPGIWNPLRSSATCGKTTNWATSAPSVPICGRPGPGPCRRSAGSPRPASTASTRRPASTGDRPMSPPSSTPP